MFRALASGTALGLLLIACNGATTDREPSTGSQKGALGTYRDGCDEAACGALPAPKHRCIGGYAASVCTKARGTCGWQVDCAKDPPTDYNPNIGVSPCGDATTGEACGAQPAWDDKDCVYGFVNTKPQCESYDRAACAWSRSCAPQPCSETGTCNILDRSKLGAACDAKTQCPDGYLCASITVNIGEYIAPVCVPRDGCVLTCADGGSCFYLESYPEQLGCGKL